MTSSQPCRAAIRSITTNTSHRHSCIGPSRFFSSSPGRHSKGTASEAADRLMNIFANTTSTARQLIDANQVQKLSLTLGRSTLSGIDITTSCPPIGTPVPPGYHLVYFTPNGVEAELGEDGTDKTYNAAEPFTRRMWAGGKMTWPHARQGKQDGQEDSLLRVGDEVEERTKLLSATVKKSKSAGEMILVEVEKSLVGPRGLCLVDQRSWIFRREIDLDALKTPPKRETYITRQPTTIRDIRMDANGFPIRELCWSPVGLFRFSALTFNGHKIHFNDDWTQLIEGHPHVVVHGPLNLINILNYWRDVHGKNSQVKGAEQLWPGEVTYRAVAPVYAGDVYTIRTGEVNDGPDGGKVYEILLEKSDVLCMKATIVA